jgi:hypothetical protein
MGTMARNIINGNPLAGQLKARKTPERTESSIRWIFFIAILELQI